jgi:hypothetical protein
MPTSNLVFHMIFPHLVRSFVRYRSLTAVSAAVCIASPAFGQGPPSSGAQGSSNTCSPTCRQGFMCHKGQCVSSCNPACELGEICGANGECVMTPASPAAGGRGAESSSCLSANESSISMQREHRLRAARTELLACSAATCPADVRDECIRRVTDINRSIPTMVFEAKDASGNDLRAVKVTVDAQPLLDQLDGTAVPVDPGQHAFAFETTGLPTVEKQLIVMEGQKERRERITFSAPEADAPHAADFVVPPVTALPASEQPTTSGDSTKRIVGFIVGGAGIVGVGVGVLEQLTALGRDSDSQKAGRSLDPDVRATAKAIHDQATQAQTYAIISGSIGAAAIGAGLYLVLSSSTSAQPRKSSWQVVPQAEAQGGEVLVRTTW